MVAASALNGYISAPTRFEKTESKTSIEVQGKASRPSAAVKIIDGFPGSIRGRALWLPVDNLNTDGIYGGEFTYKDDLTVEQMAAAAMLNYDPKFQELAQTGDVIVSGRNFGTGSSREQAATSLAFRGISCVIAASFSETYKRNAFNNGFMVIECPVLVDYLREKFAGQNEPTIVGPTMKIDYRESIIACDGKTFMFPPLSMVAQELVVAGGAENLVKQRLGQ